MKRLLMALALLPLMAAANNAVVDGIEWSYDVSDGKATVLRIPSGTTGAITIPSALGGCPVVSIGERSFDGCSGVTSVTIPSSVTSIGSYAFARCSRLSQVTVGENVQQMGRGAFSGTALMQVDGDKREIAYVGDWALGFKTCLVPDAGQISSEDFYDDFSNVRKIDIALKAGTRHIADEAFFSIRFVTKGAEPDGWDNEYTIPYGQIVLPDGLQTIGAGAFSTTFYPGSHRDRDLVIPSSVVWIGDCALSGVIDRRICFGGIRPQTDGNPFSQGHYYGGDDISTVYYVSGMEGWSFGEQWCGVKTYPYSWQEKRTSRIKLGLVYEFDRDPGEHWLVHKEEVEDDEYFAIPVTGAASASEINPVVLHHNSSPSDVSSIEIWTDVQMFNAVLKPVLSLKNKWRTQSWYDGFYIECPTSGEEAVWPADMWPADKAVPGRFWIVAKPNAGAWYGMRDFRVGLFGTDEITERIYLANESTFAPTMADKACLDTKRVSYAGRSAPRMSYGRSGPGDIGQWCDCLGGTMFETKGVRPASFTATVTEPGLLVLSVDDCDYVWDEGMQTEHYVGENFKSQMTVSGGKIVADTEESLYERFDAAYSWAVLDAVYTNLYWRYGGGGCIRRITVGEAGTYTFASKSQGDICANRFHFFPRNRDSVAIDAIFMEAEECYACSHDIANGYVLGSGVYVAGETATFTAVPAPGERFDHWEAAFGELPKGLDLKAPTLSFAVTSDMCGAMEEERQIVIRAVWEKKCRPEIIPSPVGAAAVSGNAAVFPGEEAQVALIPSAGCSFTRWVDGSGAGLSRKFSFAEAGCEEPYRAIFTGEPDNPKPHLVIDGMEDSYAVGTAIVPISVGVSDIGYVVTVGGLPPGLSFVNGRISGTPTKTGSFAVTATATKNGAQKLVRTFNIDVIFEFLYEETKDGVTLLRPLGDVSGALIIPSEYDGKKVTAIGEDFLRKNESVTSVTIGKGVLRIGEKAFSGCKKLTAVSLPEGLESIGRGAFTGFNPIGQLKSVVIPSTVRSIGSCAFACNSLESISISGGDNDYFSAANGILYDKVGRRVICSCINLTKAVLPDDCEFIGQDAFSAGWSTSSRLAEVVWPSRLKTIEQGAFHMCTKLKTGDFSSTALETVEEDVFVMCSSLSEVRFPASLRALTGHDFSCCSSLKQVYFAGRPPEVVLKSSSNKDMLDCIYVTTPNLAKAYSDAKQYTYTYLPSVTTYVTPDQGWEEICESGTWQGRPVKMKTAVSVSVVGSGTAKGGGSYDSGAKVSLKATPATGYVFAGWYEKESLPLEIPGADYRAASVSYVAPARNVEIVAKFVTKAADEAKLSVANISAGEEFVVDGDWAKQVKVDSHSIPTVSAKGLPTGLKFNAKTLTISGRPTKPGRYAVELSLKNASVKTAKKFAFTVVVPNLKSGFIAGGIDYGSDAYVYVAGTRIDPILPELEEGVTLSASGLPAGLKLVGGKNGVPYSVEGASTAKPGSYTVTLTLKKGTAKETATITVNIENRVLTLAMADVEGALTNGCKVTGGGSYAADKKVTLKATAAKNCVFAGWYRDSACTVPLEGAADFRTASYSYVTKAENETIYALFLPATEDTGITLVVDGNEVTSDAAETVFNTAGELTLALEVESVSVPKITVSGLPSGLKFTAKEVLNKDKTVLAEANTIYGAATKPGTYVVTAKLTNTTVKKAIEKKFTIVVDNLTGANDLLDVTNADGDHVRLMNAHGEQYTNVVGVVETRLPDLLSAVPGDKVSLSGLPSGLKYNAKTGKIEGVAKKAGTYTVQVKVGKAVSTFTIFVEPLPNWAVGTFVGMLRQVDRDGDGNVLVDGDGERHDWYDVLSTITVAASGKVSGKIQLPEGDSCSFSFPSISRCTADGFEIIGEVVGLGARMVATLNVSCRSLSDLPGETIGRMKVNLQQVQRQYGRTWVNCSEMTIATDEGAPLVQNAWLRKDVTLPPDLDGMTKSVDVQGETKSFSVVFKFGKNGKVTVSLFDPENIKRALGTGSATLSVLDFRDSKWSCEICASVVIKKGDKGKAGVFKVEISESGWDLGGVKRNPLCDIIQGP